MHIHELISAANCETWAMRPQSLQAVISQAKAGKVGRQVKMPRVEGSVAIIPIHGMITQRGSIWDDLFGGTSTMRFEAAFARAMSIDRIGAVVIDVDSPGGTTPGVQLAADRVFASRGGKKPVVSVVNSMADSAAYWIASSAESFVAVPGAWSIGSIGVYRMHEDISEMLANDGVKLTFISRPEFKVEGNPYEPLGEDARAFQQQQVDATYEQFNKTVARNRGVTPAHARENFGKGRDFNAEQAVQMGLVDRIVSMESLLREFGVGVGKASVEADAALTRELCSAWELGESAALYECRKSSETVQRRKALLEQMR